MAPLSSRLLPRLYPPAATAPVVRAFRLEMQVRQLAITRVSPRTRRGVGRR